ncbi:hypothetical protein BGZ74_004017, partial [Mortierella antarctica]
SIAMNGCRPSFLNLKDNIWVTEYKPSVTSGAPSGDLAKILFCGVILVIVTILVTV